MKHTKSMYYNPTDESRELTLYTENTYELYKDYTACSDNLKGKLEKGIYNHEKAVDLMFYLATRASESYYKNFGYRFSVTERYTTAVDLAFTWENDHEMLTSENPENVATAYKVEKYLFDTFGYNQATAEEILDILENGELSEMLDELATYPKSKALIKDIKARHNI